MILIAVPTLSTSSAVTHVEEHKVRRVITHRGCAAIILTTMPTLSTSSAVSHVDENKVRTVTNEEAIENNKR